MCAYRTVNGGFEIEANTPAISISVASYYLISWYIDVRIQYTLYRESGFRNLGNFGSLNPKSRALESRIQLKESGILLRNGI